MTTTIRTLSVAACALLATAAISYSHPGNHGQPGKVSDEAVLVGNGVHRFMTVPHWGELPDDAKIGPTHGDVAVSKAGDVYVSTQGDKAICVFNSEGKFLRSIAAPDCVGTHGLMIREEDGTEYIYGAHLKGERVVKLDLDGNLVMEIASTDEQPIPGTFKGLTDVTVLPDDRIVAVVGYGSNQVHIFDEEGVLLKSFGGSKGTGPEQFNVCHNVSVDERFEEPRLLISDRQNGRLLHYDFDGNFISEHASHMRQPCALDFRGDFCAVSELGGRVTILDKYGLAVAFLGDNPNTEQRATFKVPLDEIPAGIFTAPHGISYDDAGNLYVQDYNETGRVTKLERVE